jgi:hypothetical protein
MGESIIDSAKNASDDAPRGTRSAMRAYYGVWVGIFTGLGIAFAGIWGVLRTLIVQLGLKKILYDPDASE